MSGLFLEFPPFRVWTPAERQTAAGPNAERSAGFGAAREVRERVAGWREILRRTTPRAQGKRQAAEEFIRLATAGSAAAAKV
eukprot:11166172-Lingulodinium_polyedra.AAC.1